MSKNKQKSSFEEHRDSIEDIENEVDKDINEMVMLEDVTKISSKQSSTSALDKMLEYQEAKANLPEVRKLILTEADLSNANLTKANLRYSNLFKANLSNANLTEVDLREVDLTKANLSVANLTGANLIGANLSNAHLSIFSKWNILYTYPDKKLSLKIL